VIYETSTTNGLSIKLASYNEESSIDLQELGSIILYNDVSTTINIINGTFINGHTYSISIDLIYIKDQFCIPFSIKLLNFFTI
jgi:hypothetical protein